MLQVAIGGRYTRKEIHDQVNGKGNQQMGIVNCDGEPYVLIFKTIAGAKLYPDRKEDDGTLLYMGSGQAGDQEMKGAN